MSNNAEQALPAALESERAALGSVLIQAGLLATVLANVRVEEFVLSSHREILRAIVSLNRRQRTVDLVTVVQELRQAGTLESVGGAAYVASLVDNVPDRPQVEAYALNVHDAARARALHAAATLACTSIEQGRMVDEVLSRLQQKELELSQVKTRGPQRLFVSAPNFITDAPNKIDWLVDGLIEKGANGFFVAVPKGGKS